MYNSVKMLIKAVGDNLKVNALKIPMSENVLTAFDLLTNKLQDMKRANNNLQTIYDNNNGK